MIQKQLILLALFTFTPFAAFGMQADRKAAHQQSVVQTANEDLSNLLRIIPANPEQRYGTPYFLNQLKKYIELGADVNARDGEGVSRIGRAILVESPSIEVVKLLIENGADKQQRIAHGHKLPIDWLEWSIRLQEMRLRAVAELPIEKRYSDIKRELPLVKARIESLQEIAKLVAPTKPAPAAPPAPMPQVSGPSSSNSAAAKPGTAGSGTEA